MLVDITRRVLAEIELQRNIRAPNLLQDIAVAAKDATSPEEAIQVCLDAVCAATGWPNRPCTDARQRKLRGNRVDKDLAHRRARAI
jgi:hypothetical protein